MDKKKIVTLITTAAILFSTVGTAAAAPGENKIYTDVKSTHWAAASIQDMSAKKIIVGYQDGTFKPSQTLTYGEFIKMMVVAVTGQELELASKPKHWAYNYYAKGIKLGLYTGNDIEETVLNKKIPRKYMALIISNGLEDNNTVDYNELDKRIANQSEIESKINDVNDTVKYNYHIIRTYAEGIISGYQDGSFKPDGTLTRAESTVVLQRFLDPGKRHTKINNPYTITLLDNDNQWRDYQVESYEITLPNKGITGIDKGSKWIKVTTDKPIDFILYAGKTSIPPVGNADGTNYFKTGSMYLYYFNPSTMDITNKSIAIQMMDDENNVYILKGVKF